MCANRLSDSFIVRGENVRSQAAAAVTNHRNLITCEYKSHIWEWNCCLANLILLVLGSKRYDVFFSLQIYLLYLYYYLFLVRVHVVCIGRITRSVFISNQILAFEDSRKICCSIQLFSYQIYLLVHFRQIIIISNCRLQLVLHSDNF